MSVQNKNRKSRYKGLHISGWNVAHEQAIMDVSNDLKSQGINFEYGGRDNRSAILLYLLMKEAARLNRKRKG